MEDVHAAGIHESDIPIIVSVKQMKVIYKNRSFASDVMPLPSMPHLEDPWGGLICFELLSMSPMHWRVTSRVGRTFLGDWISGTRDSMEGAYET